MEVAEFDHLNAGSAQVMEPSGSDWIGINSPDTFVFRQGKEEIRFTGTRRGGGMMVASSEFGLDGVRHAPARVTSIAFNIGGGMEDIAAYEPFLASHCCELADWRAWR